MSLLTQYKAAKEAGLVSVGDNSKPVHLIKTTNSEGEVVNGQVDVYAPQPTGEIDPTALQPTVEVRKIGTYHPQYVEHLRAQAQLEKEKLLARVDEINADEAIYSDFLADVTTVSES